MTTAAVMSDDHLDPDSLVGRMLRQSESEYLPNTTEASEPPATVEPLPLWRVLERAHEQEAGSMIDYLGNTVLGEPDRDTRAAEIEALRDWLLPEEPEPSAYDGRPRYEQRHIIWTHNRKLRAALTEQARIARTGQ